MPTNHRAGTRIEAREISIRLAGRNVINSLSIGLRSGELVGVMGPNGAGKSTLLRALGGLVRTEGEIRLVSDGTDSPDPHRRRALSAYVPQWPLFTWPLSVLRIVASGRRPFWPSLAAGLRRDDRDAAERAMKRMHLDHLATRPATQLSRGETARMQIARAMARETPVLLADEPTAGLDPAHQVALMRGLRGLADEGHVVVVALHDLGLAARWCTRLVLLDHGAIAVDGTPGAVLKQKNLADVFGVRAYLGNAGGGPVVELLDTVENK